MSTGDLSEEVREISEELVRRDKVICGMKDMR